jgi:hypothetical protein
LALEAAAEAAHPGAMRRSIPSSIPSSIPFAIPLALCTLWLTLTTATVEAGRKKPAKKYFFEVTSVTSKATLPDHLEKAILPRLSAEVTKQLQAHPQLVTALPDAPSPDDAAKFRRYLTKRGLAGAYQVSVELTSASEEIEPMEGRTGQRLIVRLGVHMFGETVPGKTIGFTGDGSASIRQEVGKTVRPRDQEFTWQGAVEMAVNDAISTSLTKLSAPEKK